MVATFVSYDWIKSQWYFKIPSYFFNGVRYAVFDTHDILCSDDHRICTLRTAGSRNRDEDCIKNTSFYKSSQLDYLKIWDIFLVYQIMKSRQRLKSSNFRSGGCVVTLFVGQNCTILDITGNFQTLYTWHFCVSKKIKSICTIFFNTKRRSKLFLVVYSLLCILIISLCFS